MHQPPQRNQRAKLTRPAAALQCESGARTLTVLRAQAAASRCDFVAVTAQLQPFLNDEAACCVFQRALYAVAMAAGTSQTAAQAAVDAGFIELATRTLGVFIECQIAVDRAAMVLKLLSPGREAQARRAGAVAQLCFPLTRLRIAPAWYEADNESACSCLGALRVVTGGAFGAAAAWCSAALGQDAGCGAVEAAKRALEKTHDADDRAEQLRTSGDLLSHLLTACFDKAMGSSAGPRELKAVTALMQERPTCATTQRWALAYAFLPLAGHEMQARRARGVSACAPRTMAALVTAGALPSPLANALRAHPSASTWAAQLLTQLVGDTDLRAALHRADPAGELAAALRVATYAARKAIGFAAADASYGAEDGCQYSNETRRGCAPGALHMLNGARDAIFGQAAPRRSGIDADDDGTVGDTDAVATPAPAPRAAAGTCANCGAKGPGLKRCAACSAVQYCGKECQTAHWGAHKASCKAAAAKR